MPDAEWRVLGTVGEDTKVFRHVPTGGCYFRNRSAHEYVAWAMAPQSLCDWLERWVSRAS